MINRWPAIGLDWQQTTRRAKYDFGCGIPQNDFEFPEHIMAAVRIFIYQGRAYG